MLMPFNLHKTLISRSGKLLKLVASLYVVSLLVYQVVQGQQFNFRTFTTREGLANNGVRDIVIDSSGFLWAATWDGLSRYDGYEFKNYYHVPGDSMSLPYFALRDLAVDGANNLWVLTDMGQLVCYDRANDNFKKIKGIPFPEVQQNASIDVDQNGNLWFISESQILKRNFRTGIIEACNIYQEESTYFNPGENYMVNSVNDNEIWLSGTDLYHLTKRASNDSEKQTFIVDSEYKIFHSRKNYFSDFYDRKWSELYISPKGTKWVLSNFGLFRLGKDNEFTEFQDSIPDGEFVGNRLFVWENEKYELFVYNPFTGRTERVENELLPYALVCLRVNKNLLWFSARSLTGNSLGLVEVMVSHVIFKNYQVESGISPSDAVYSLYKDHSGVIWTGIRGRDCINLIKPNGTVSGTGFLSAQIVQSVGHLRSIIRTNEGLWLGYYSKLLEFYDFKSGKFIDVTPEGPEFFHTLLPDKEGNILIATNQIYKFNPKTKRAVPVWVRHDDDYTIYRLVRDSRGILWAGSKGNILIRINPADWSSQLIKLGEDTYNLEDICEGDNNDLWVAMLGGGVCNYSPVTGKMKFYTTANGLSNNTTYSILKDKGGYIWVTTNNGISRIDPRTGFIKVFNISDGLNIVEFNSDASFVTDDGEFLLGGIGGFTSFYPDRVMDVGSSFGKQRVLITDLSVSGTVKHFKRSVNDSDTIILQKGENNFRITFSSTDFENSEKTKYRYHLRGINKGWVETSYRDRSVNFANLKPGLYDFEIQATDENNDWCKPKFLKIRIKPYFYQTLAVKIVFPLIIVCLSIFAVFLYVRNLRQKQSQMLDSLRLQTLRGQMNPHFVFNSLNSINYFISNNDKLSANRYIADFAKLIRSILSNMNQDFITLDAEIESLSDYLKIEYLRFGDKFNYEILIDPALEPGRYKVSPGLIQPFVENSIWHGIRGLRKRKGRITLTFRQTDGKVRCSIEDDGIGRKKAESYKYPDNVKKSHGIAIVLERLRIINHLMKSDYQVTISDCFTDREDTGTRVVIDLPVIPD